jgi:hypothetical protein
LVNGENTLKFDNQNLGAFSPAAEPQVKTALFGALAAPQARLLRTPTIACASQAQTRLFQLLSKTSVL